MTTEFTDAGGNANGSERRISSIERLKEEPYQFGFFQAVRLLELADRIANPLCNGDYVNPVGHDFAPESEVVRFRANPSQSFPGSEILSLTPAEEDSENGATSPPQMTVSFLGLTGPSGALPQHYTQRLIDELRNDSGMRDFFDLFNHRLLSMFYRVWKKNRFPIAYETDSFAKKSLQPDKTDSRDIGDLFTFGLFCSIGLGTGGLCGRQLIPDEGLLFYGGQFAHDVPRAVSLERMVSHYFGYPCEVMQFIGQWLQLRPSEQSTLSMNPLGLGNNALGESAVAGERVWSIENKFRLRIGSLRYSDFWDLMPGVRQQEPLVQFMRSYVGPDYDFEIQLVLKKKEVPACCLGVEGMHGAYLGWNTWAFSEPFTEDADDVVFQIQYP